VADRYDAVVIGAGPAGTVAAGELADGGMKVAIVESELVGGECSYWACIPSKTLLRPPEAVHDAKDASGAAEAVTGSIDTGAALGWRDYMVSDYDDSGPSAAGWLESAGIDLFRGNGAIDGPGRVRVGDQVIEADKILLATGSSPVIPPIDGLDEVDGIWTNREATGMKSVPESVVVMGAGPVGCEMSQILQRLGAQVTLLDGSGHALPREAKEAGLAIEEVLAADGVDVRCGTRAESVSQSDDGTYTVALNEGDPVTCQKVLVATGRKPRVDDIGLESVGAAFDQKSGIEVNEQLQVAGADNVWAIGDATGIALFTHVGKYQARIAAADMLGKPARADYRAIPRVVFTDPQVASVGESEGAQTGTVEMKAVARTATYMRDYDKQPGFLTLVSDGTKLTGAYAVGPEAGEWLGQATLAVRAEVPLEVLRDTIQPFPSFSEAFVSALADLG
jgi:pyruvate/2-oxoglutarate dehydrogenase complex dihydrolipoamide dehydrogenase (E3) component